MRKHLFFFEEADPADKKLLGGKGAGLCQIRQLGLSIPPGFVITTETCKEYYAAGGRLPDGLMKEVEEAIKRLEKETGKIFGGSQNPLLVSARSGAAASMPGMMDTILNLGLNDRAVKGLAKVSGDERFASDAYRRFLQMFAKIALGVDERIFSVRLEEVKEAAGVRDDSDLKVEDLRRLTGDFKEIIAKETGQPFPDDQFEQLRAAIEAVFKSWNGRRSVDYRREMKITPDVADGTAASIVSMVFGNMGGDSATGVVFTRDPASGAKGLYGDFLVNAQGEDVVAGTRTPRAISELQDVMPKVYRELVDVCGRLEQFFKEPQDIEFTVERGRLYVLQTRAAKMNAAAMVKTSVDLANEGLISREQALLRIEPNTIEQLLHRRVDPSAKAKPVATGIPASPGAASGVVVFEADDAEEKGKKGLKVILVREETKPEDIHGFFAAQGILTSRGGKTSHAAVVARGMGKPCVTGCSEVKIDLSLGDFYVNKRLVKMGDVITIDGTSGHVYLGEVPTLEPEMSGELSVLLSWADEVRRLGVRANADTPNSALYARQMGAEGIGLCRTERMFNAVDRLPIVVGMIMAEDADERRRALSKLAPVQKNDFKEILKAMEGFPVTIRLLDPPLHEFLPRVEELMLEIHEREASGLDGELEVKKKILGKAKELAEVNPMLGHRGVRVGVTYPEIYGMQIRAICEATAELVEEGVVVKPQIMVPQVTLAEELKFVKNLVDNIKSEVEGKLGRTLPIKFGTMIEVVRACTAADELAQYSEFFSFGTNDLTQGTFSFSREDAENKFLPDYVSKGLLSENPFQSVDTKGVGRLMEICVQLARGVKQDLEIGICGEHGGDPSSIMFCDRVNLSYVSCSPYRIPAAKLAAAHASLQK